MDDGIIVAKSFRDGWADARDRAGAMALAAKGGTAMMPGIITMANRLRARGGVSRRVLIVLTDGEDRYNPNSNRAAIAAAEAHGVEVVGLGMCHDASHIFTRHVLINDLNAVADRGLGALLDVLNGKGRALRAA